MSKLKKLWTKAAEDLQIEIELDFKLVLGAQVTLSSMLLVKGYGAKNGMLIFLSFDQIEKFHSEILDQGYGYSI